MIQFVSNNEIKKILGLGSANDALVDMWNVSAHEILLDLIETEDLAKHQVTDERVFIAEGCVYEMILEQFPVDASTITLKDKLGQAILNYTFKADPRRRRVVRSYLNDNTYPQPLMYNEMLVSYQAGFTIQDTLKILSLTGLDGKTFTMKTCGVTTTYTMKNTPVGTNDIAIAIGDINTTALNIATKIGGTVATDTVTAPVGSYLSLGASVSSATTAEFTITAQTMPQTLKNAVCFIAGGGMAEKQKLGGVSSYLIGASKKQVQFRTNTEASITKQIIDNWLQGYKKVFITRI